MAKDTTNQDIFKAYDIRGIYPRDINEEVVGDIVRAYAEYLKPKTIVIGHDVRLSSPILYKKVLDILLKSGIDIIGIGLTTTPLFYFSVIKSQSDGGLMVSASHNPKEYNGLKLTSKNARPIGADSGLDKIKEIYLNKKFSKISGKGKLVNSSFLPDYVNFLTKDLPFIKLRVVADASSGASGQILRPIFEKLGGELIPQNFEPDGNFPAHAPDPWQDNAFTKLASNVLKDKANLGVIFDGDGDRIFFVDEKGEPISSDLIMALLSNYFLSKEKGVIVYDVRSSKIVEETIKAGGGQGQISRVGHSFFKKMMADKNAIFGGEGSGHYYFRETGFVDDAVYAMMKILQIIQLSGKTLSELAAPFRKYFRSGEINFEVAEKEALLKRIEQNYKKMKGVKIQKIDGLSVEFWNPKKMPSWWFNIRPSNTEPLVRLNIEASSEELLREKIKEIELLIKGF